MMQNKKKILIVDDDELHLYTTRELLQEERFEVFTHKNGFGVTHLVNMLQPDLVLLDVHMPGLSGDQLASLLRADSGAANVPVVFHSSNDEDSLRESVSLYGAKGYICKGNVADLKKKVHQYLGISAHEGETGNS
jgi:CheY-like chemotaxis protein